MSTENEKKKEYNIDDDKDYVIIIRPDGTSNGFYPNEVMESQGQIDARFIAATYVLQSQESFDYVVEKFRQEKLPQMQQAAAESSADEATPGGEEEAAAEE